MAYRMSKTERIKDIANRCGFSEETVATVLKAETASMMQSLRKGEKVTLPGRVIVTPVYKGKLSLENGQAVAKKYLSANAKPMQSILDQLEYEGENTENKSDNNEEDIVALMNKYKIAQMQVAALE